MLIAVDIDDVLADFVTSISRFHNEFYKTSLKRNQFKTSYYEDTWGGTRKEAIRKVYEFHKTPLSFHIKPIKGAREGIKKLREEHELVVITSRPSDFEKKTRDWLDVYFPQQFSRVFFTNHFSKSGGPTKRKVDICLDLKVDVMIDDSADFIMECYENNVRALLFHTPWNRKRILPSSVQRVTSWPEIVSIINT